MVDCPFYHYIMSFSSSGNFLCFNVNIADSYVFWLIFAWYILFHPFTFNLPKSFFFFNFFFNKFIYLFIYLFLAVLVGLCFCARAFSSCGERGPLFIVVRGPLTVVASPVAEHELQTRKLSSCGSRA